MLKILKDIPPPQWVIPDRTTQLTKTLKAMEVGDSFISSDRPNRAQMWRLKPKRWITRRQPSGIYRTWRVE